MAVKLREFYLYYYMPYLVKHTHLSDDDRKWCTSKTIKFLNNGLIDDINYYRRIPCGKDYFVAVFDNSEFRVKEILISNFMSLSGKDFRRGIL